MQDLFLSGAKGALHSPSDKLHWDKLVQQFCKTDATVDLCHTLNRITWKTATQKAKVQGIHFHFLREKYSCLSNFKNFDRTSPLQGGKGGVHSPISFKH